MFGFAKVAVFSILCSKTELQKKIGGTGKELKSRELKLKFEQYKVTFNFVKFDIEYRQFIQNFKKIINNIKSLEKRHKDTKTEILQTFSLSKWDSLSDSNKLKHSLVECGGCLDNKEYRQILAKFPIRDLKCRAKDSKQGLFKDKVLSDITNVVVNKLDEVYKNVFNETLTSSAGITNTPTTASNTKALNVRKIQRSTAKLLKTNIENIWTERSVETYVHYFLLYTPYSSNTS